MAGESGAPVSIQSTGNTRNITDRGVHQYVTSSLSLSGDDPGSLTYWNMKLNEKYFPLVDPAMAKDEHEPLFEAAWTVRPTKPFKKPPQQNLWVTQAGSGRWPSS